MRSNHRLKFIIMAIRQYPIGFRPLLFLFFQFWFQFPALPDALSDIYSIPVSLSLALNSM